MSRSVYFQRGAYPYESMFGILFNISSIYNASLEDTFKHVSGRSLNFPEDLLYFEKVPGSLPKARLSSLAQHVPSAYRVFGFSAEEKRLRYCEDCLCLGYHSVFFCLPQVKFCLVHDKPLAELCESCQREIPKRVMPVGVCEECGFQWLRPTEQLKFRADGKLVRMLAAIGGKQKAWFEFITERARGGQNFFMMLDQVDDYFGTPSLQALVTRFELFPFAEKTEARPTRMLHCIRWNFISEPDSDVGWMAACEQLVRVHLKNHDYCLGRYANYLRCWDGYELDEEVCLLSVTYFLVRLRLSSLSLQHGRSSKLDDLSFSYVRMLEQSFSGFRFVPVELVFVYYLKLMFHINSYLQEGYVVHIAMQPWRGVFYDLAARSVGVNNVGETFLAIVPLSERSCIQALSGELGLNTEQYRLKRIEENYFTLSRGDASDEKLVSVLI
ncbi:hypothetical protein [Pseudomonas abietaniphila]|uniref:TniQ protein n=1 Tax=Pseudomonas abietaniphila TaxID=89065 RepID=A0A1G7VGN3_9PSED|nr:hypothetical protein [Pseudomonas abietaniphila]SDG58893.1 hypothetical protein SAMN05216605_102496 [Pseudomonas abietaniphila]